jgi:CheY-like chemotaxis protein
MPGTDGYELLRSVIGIRQSNPPLVAIAITGYASQKDRERAFEVGFQAHLAKPFEPIELIRSIKELAHNRELRARVRT